MDPELIGAIAEAIEEAVHSGDPEKQDAVEELGEAIETILEPGVSTTVEETEQEEQDATDAIGRAVIRKLQPALARMPKKQRKKATAAIDSIFRDTGKGNGVYAGLVAAARKGYSDPRDLGKAIMKKRNPNYEGD